MGLADSYQGVLQRFRGLTLPDGSPMRAVADPQDVVPPCVWVPLPEAAFTFSKSRAELTWTAYLVGPTAPKAGTTAEALSVLIDLVAGLFAFTTGELYSLTLQGGGPPAQSYRLQWLQPIQIGVDDGQ